MSLQELIDILGAEEFPDEKLGWLTEDDVLVYILRPDLLHDDQIEHAVFLASELPDKMDILRITDLLSICGIKYDMIEYNT